MNKRKLGFLSFKSLVVNLMVILLMCVAVLFGVLITTSNSLSQEVIQQANGLATSMQEKEKSLVQILRDKKMKETSPHKVLESIQQIGMLARLKSVSSSDTIISTDAIVALADQLDFRKDSAMPKKDVVVESPDVIFEPHPIGPNETYPAIEALEYIGEVALPVLTKIIENEKGNSIKAQNALNVIKFNYRENHLKAADYLRQSAGLTKSKAGKRRLLLAANKIQK